jgi:hypothetical protein
MSTIRPEIAGMSQIVAGAGGVIASAGPATARGWMAVSGRSPTVRADADPRRCHTKG